MKNLRYIPPKSICGMGSTTDGVGGETTGSFVTASMSLFSSGVWTCLLLFGTGDRGIVAVLGIGVPLRRVKLSWAEDRRVSRRIKASSSRLREGTKRMLSTVWMSSYCTMQLTSRCKNRSVRADWQRFTETSSLVAPSTAGSCSRKKQQWVLCNLEL